MISIIVPIYNKEKYIVNCVESLLKQRNVELEIILVNDGSTDNSLSICKRIENENENVIVINQKNAGVSVARNEGMNRASGEWISFVDPDDYVAPTLYQELLKKSENCDIVACCCYAVDGEKMIENQFFESDYTFESTDDKTELYCQLLYDHYRQPGATFTAIGVPWGKIYHRTMLLKNKLQFNTKLRRQQDNVFNMHAFSVANRIRYINRPLYYYTLDNVKDYYVSKYNSYATKNAIELQMERHAFFVLGNKLNSIKLKKNYDNETICTIFGALNKNILHRNNPQSYTERKKEFYKLVKDSVIEEDLRYINRSNIEGIFHKFVFDIIQIHGFGALNLIWKTRLLYEYVKFGKGSIK